MLSGALVLLSLASFVGTRNPDLIVLSESRGVAGIALGAFPPLMVAYLTDLLPPRQRGTLILAVAGIGYLGPPGTIFLPRWLTPLEPPGVSASGCKMRQLGKRQHALHLLTRQGNSSPCNKFVGAVTARRCSYGNRCRASRMIASG